MLALFRTSTALPLPQARRKGPLARIDAAFRLWREREDLARLDDRMLRDVGLSRRDVSREKERPIWDAPAWWR